jgi:photosystem II stability/assembly factor-like uncharacterized protein
MKGHLLLIFSLISIASMAQIDGLHVNPDPIVGNLGNRIDDVYMLNDHDGYAITSEGWIVKTEDAFKHHTVSFALPGYGRSIEFLNDSTGFAGSIDGYLYQTTSYGNSWRRIDPLVFAGDTIVDTSAYAVRGVCGLAKAGKTMYACGAYWGNAYVAKYQGYSRPWKFFDMKNYAFGLVDIYFINEDIGFVSGTTLNQTGGIILCTRDGGEHWYEVYSTNEPWEIIWKLYPLNDSIIYGCIQQSNGFARIVKSLDTGVYWNEFVVDSTAFRPLQMVGFVDENIGYAGGHMDGYYKTVDGGVTWSYKLKNGVWNLNRFFRINDTLSFASGGDIYRISDTAVVNTGIEQSEYTEEISITANPNPSSTQVAIIINSVVETGAYLVVYNSEGKAFYKKPYSKWLQGQSAIMIDVSGFPVGNYYSGFISDYGNYTTTFTVVH